MQAIKQDLLVNPTMSEGLVIGGGNENWIIQSSSGHYKANKAVSCLVSPMMGDTVLTVILASGQVSILAVLDRKLTSATQIKIDGDVELCSTQSIKLIARKEVSASAAESISFYSKELSIHSGVTALIFDSLNFTGRHLKQVVGKVDIVAKCLETISDSSKVVAKNSFRVVSGLESTVAGNVMQRVKKRFSVTAKQANILADEDAKVNGKRVHLG